MSDTRHFGLIGGLGVGAAVLYYQEIVRMCAERGRVARLTLAHANAPTALAHVQAGRIAGLADYLSGFIGELKQAGASIVAIPAITPHICRAELRERIDLEFVDILDVVRDQLNARRLHRVAIFGTSFTIDSDLFGALHGIDIVRPRQSEVAEIHRIYLELAQKGACSPEDVNNLRAMVLEICARDNVESILLAGTDLNLIFNEATAGFPAVDCAAAHITEIVDRMC